MKNDATQVTLSRWTSEAMTAPTLHAQVLALRRTNSARAVAQALGIPLGTVKPINTPVCSPQSNGMAERFVNTFKRDYMSRIDLRDAPTVLAQLAGAFEHFNEVHPHPSLKMPSPREYRRRQNLTTREG